VSGSIPFIDADAVHAALDWKVLIDALRAGLAYVNVHTDLSPGGEIRGQLK